MNTSLYKVYIYIYIYDVSYDFKVLSLLAGGLSDHFALSHLEDGGNDVVSSSDGTSQHLCQPPPFQRGRQCDVVYVFQGGIRLHCLVCPKRFLLSACLYNTRITSPPSQYGKGEMWCGHSRSQPKATQRPDQEQFEATGLFVCHSNDMVVLGELWCCHLRYGYPIGLPYPYAFHHVLCRDDWYSYIHCRPHTIREDQAITNKHYFV